MTLILRTTAGRCQALLWLDSLRWVPYLQVAEPLPYQQGHALVLGVLDLRALQLKWSAWRRIRPRCSNEPPQRLFLSKRVPQLFRGERGRMLVQVAGDGAGTMGVEER